MKPRTFARRPSSIGSNQLSKSRPSASPVRADVILLIMAWSPARRSNAGIRVANPGDYATKFQPPSRRHRCERHTECLSDLGQPRNCHAVGALLVFLDL